MKKVSLKQNLFDIALTFARRFLSGLIQLGTILVLAQFLGAEGLGVYSVALLLPSLMALAFNFGLSSANTFYIASGEVTLPHAWAATRDVAGGIIFVGTLCGGLFIHWFGEVAFPGVPRLVLLMALLTFPVNLLLGVVTGFFLAAGDFRSFNATVLIQPICTFCAIIGLWLWGGVTLENVFIAVVVSYLLALIFSLKLLTKWTELGTRASGKITYLRKAFTYGLKAHLGNIISFLNYRLDLFLVNLFVGPEGAGIYMVAVRLVEQLWMISQAVSTVLFPRLSAMKNDDEDKGALTALLARMVLWLTGVSAAGLALVASPIISVLFGEEFADGVVVLYLLLPGVVVFSCARTLANDWAARGMVGVNLVLALVAFGVNAIANLLFIPMYGIYGAAIATSMTYVLVFVIRLGLLNKLSDVVWWAPIVLRRQDLSSIRALVSRVRPRAN
ncbi:hypothetical protein GCM10007939_22590 [Amylibacter marinus]|uniref:Membrane protein involved in the export of O-antigen and teichoic acid n=1 Tax=Amylibacter marinus TaxID=1475483 RepID=A0ABQ5VX22_9RHOB|nr:oligosaccharide flippase family protein [Amylibacter marinus]GLQ35975.1 hypothetical protein GCM10007939_22590 [Amylibacter marinus]